jgi:hypothetical protein
MRILTSGAVILLLAGCSGGITPEAGVQGTVQPDCDAAVKPTGTVGVTIGKNGIRPKAGLGLNIDLLKLGKSRDTAVDCAKAGLKTGANANVGISVGG